MDGSRFASRARSLAASAVLFVLATLALPSAAVAAPPRCFGKPATYVMQPGDPSYGGSGDDLQVTANGAGGRAKGGSGSDFVLVSNGATGDGGSGNDTVVGRDAAALFGGSGSDTVVNQVGNPKIDCGAAFDTVTPNGATDVRRCERTIAQP